MTETRTENIEDLPDEFLECRDIGHSWRQASRGLGRGGIVLIRFLRCRTCHSLRKDTFHRVRGVMVSRSYHYSEGYLMAKGRAPRASHPYRAELMRRLDDAALPEWGDDADWSLAKARRKR